MSKTSAAIKAMKDRRPSKERIIEALRAHNGIVASAARSLNVYRGTLYEWMNADESGDIAAALKDIRETTTDVAVGKLLENIIKGKSEDIRFYLRCFGKDRGYVETEKVEVSHSGVIANINIETTDPNEAAKVYQDMIAGKL